MIYPLLNEYIINFSQAFTNSILSALYYTECISMRLLLRKYTENSCAFIFELVFHFSFLGRRPSYIEKAIFSELSSR